MILFFTDKAAVQSSTFYNAFISYNYEAENAVDGDYVFEASSSTNSEKQPYWMVNLGYACHIWAVKTFNSPQCKCNLLSLPLN